ncbi:hypothetical protein GQ600_1985 [Phytophthora cactorum]|nr:hypothetical protein GQ600_1985 [Phytophthora cactorum]
MQTIAGMETEATGNAGTGRLSRTPDRLSTSFPHTRISPYPQRARKPVRRSPSAEQPDGGRQQLTLVVQPIIKSTIDQRDASGVALEDITVSGVTFTEIIALLFEQLSARIKGRAVQTDDGWSLQPVIMVDWAKLMQFRFKRHGIETTKAEEAWNQWVKRAQGFVHSATSNRQIGRSRRMAHVGQPHYPKPESFPLDRLRYPSTTRLCGAMLNAADSRLEQHRASLNRSAKLAPDCVAAPIADNAQLQNDDEAIGRRLEVQNNRLQNRKEIIEAFIREIPPPCPPRHRRSTSCN